jgi:hypothetical protein
MDAVSLALHKASPDDPGRVGLSMATDSGRHESSLASPGLAV